MGFRKKAVGYLRTSSMANVGEDKATKPRQQEAIRKYALRENIQVVKEFYDEGVKGTIPVMDRPEFSRLIKFAIDNSIDTILVEKADRFSRDALIGLIGHDQLKKISITLVPVDAPSHYLEDTPSNRFFRTVWAAMAQLDKENLVEKMAHGRQVKRKQKGRCEGRIPPKPEAVALAIKLREEQGMSYKKIGEELSRAGFRVIQKNSDDVPEVTNRIYQPGSVKNMIENLGASYAEKTD